MRTKPIIALLAMAAIAVFSCKKDVTSPSPADTPAETGRTVQDLVLDLDNRTYRSGAAEAFFSTARPDGSVQSRTMLLEAQVANQMMYEADAEVPFVDDWIAEYGLPCWGCATSGDFGDHFDVSIPFYDNGELTAVVVLLSLDGQGVSVHVRSAEFDQAIRPYYSALVTNYFHYLFDKLRRAT